MKTNRILCLCAAIALPQFALAEPPFSGESLAKLQSTLDFCAQRNPQAAIKYREQAKLLIQGVTEKEAAEMRKTEEYKEAYKANTAALAEVSEQEVAEACNGFLLEALK